MHRVPPSLRLKQQQCREHYVYEPMVISLGPFENLFSNKWRTTSRNPSLCLFPAVAETRDSFTSRFSSKSMTSGVVTLECLTDLYDDEALCLMMLRDSCFLVCYMKVAMGDRDMNFHMSHLGASASALMDPDMYMLENQIPYSVIKLLIESRFGGNEGKSLLCKYFSSASFGYDQILETIPREADKEEEPLHLLQAFQKIFSGDSSRKKSEKNNKDSYNFRDLSSDFRCVTDLKEKGKDFKPSSNCLVDVRFESQAFYEQLKLPIWSVSPDDKVFFANMVAFKTSPGTRANFTLTSYINFMKTLIESSEDVKELKEKGILFGNLGNDEEVVEVFQEIDTFGVDSVSFLRCQDENRNTLQQQGKNMGRGADSMYCYCLARCHFYPCLNFHPNSLHRLDLYLAWLT